MVHDPTGGRDPGRKPLLLSYARLVTSDLTTALTCRILPQNYTTVRKLNAETNNIDK